MSRWPLVQLSEVLAQKRREELVTPERSYRLLGAHWYAKGLYVKEERLGAQIRSEKVYRVTGGDFVYNRLFAWKGAFAVAPADLDDTYVSNEFPCFSVDEDRLSPEYIWLYFSRESVWTEALGLSFGATPTSRNRLKESRLIAMRMPLPSLQEQLRIVAELRRNAALVERVRNRQRQVDIELRMTEKSVASQALRRIESALWKPLGDLADICGGNTPSKTNPAFWDGQIPWVSPKDIKRREIWEATDHISEAAVSQSGARVHEPGCVLVVVRGMILAHAVPSAVLKTRAAINQDMKALRPVPGVLPEYLCCALWGLNGEILEMVDRSGHDTRKLTTPNLAACAIPVPSIPEQRRLIGLMLGTSTRISRALALLKQSGEAVDALRSSVLSRTFSG